MFSPRTKEKILQVLSPENVMFWIVFINSILLATVSFMVASTGPLELIPVGCAFVIIAFTAFFQWKKK